MVQWIGRTFPNQTVCGSNPEVGGNLSPTLRDLSCTYPEMSLHHTDNTVKERRHVRESNVCLWEGKNI